MPFVSIDQAWVHYTVRPGGPNAIVFLHGGFGSSSHLWAGTMERLPADWTGYAIDNFLHSDAPPEGYTMAAFARRAASFVAAMGHETAVFAGHSMGGGISQLTAIGHAATVSGLVLVCTGAAMTDYQSRFGRELLATLAQSGGDAATIRDISAKWFRDPPPEPFFSDYVARAVQAPLQAMLDAQSSWIDIDLRPDLGSITAPTLVVFGPHDAGRTIEHAQTIVNGIPGARMVTMDGSGHTPMADTPELFDTALHAFLKHLALAGAST